MGGESSPGYLIQFDLYIVISFTINTMRFYILYYCVGEFVLQHIGIIAQRSWKKTNHGSDENWIDVRSTWTRT